MAVGCDRVDRGQHWLHWRTLRKWVRQGERDNGVRPGPTTAEQQRIMELEHGARELRKTNEILKLASACFAQAEFERHLRE